VLVLPVLVLVLPVLVPVSVAEVLQPGTPGFAGLVPAEAVADL
jgi:hypothetical protein